MKSPMPLLRSLLIDFSRLEPDVKGLDRDFRTIQRRFKHEGYGFLTITLPAFCDSFDEGLSDGQFCCPLGFRKSKGSSLPRFLSGLTSEVFDPITGLVKENPNVGCIISIRQLGRLFKKVSLDSENSDKLHSEAVGTFFDTDSEIDRFILNDRDMNLYRSVSEIVLPSLRDGVFDPYRMGSCSSQSDDPLCNDLKLSMRHGPGNVAEDLKLNQKWESVYKGIITDAFDTGLFGYDLFALQSRDPLSVSPDSQKGIVDRSLSSARMTNAFSKASGCIARLVSVAKNSTSRRTITIEPCLYQFVQQGLNTALRDSISKCSILKLSLALTDQTENQKLALEGSLHANWSTIDLKSASDLLSVRMVENTFPKSTLFFETLMSCRSDIVSEPLNGPRNIIKYAGMGNATTFPVQSVVFALLAITAIVDKGACKPSYWNVKRAARHVRVFGDDIIISTQHVHEVVNWISQAGLKVNQRKSFLNGNFKESCGVDAYKGVDITPLYCRHRPDDSSMEPSAIAGLISFSNNAWMRGLYKTSACIANEVEERLGYRLQLVSRNSSALGWHSRQDAMNPNAWDRRLQRLITKAPVLVPLKRRDKLDGNAALLKFFHVPLIGRPVDHLQKTSMRFKLRIAKKRVPTEVGKSC